MSETFFSLNDLLRRKLQTSVVIASLALCVASTLFLLLLSDKIGFGILSVAENRLTVSFSTVLSRFIVFVGFLIFVAAVVIVSFMTFVMMSQRTRDIGLMKAVGCPNDLIFGYFMNELAIVVATSCFLGVLLGLAADYASNAILGVFGINAPQGSINLWLALLVFAIFLVLSLVIGAKPILDTTKVEPAKALSPNFSIGLSKESDFRGVSKAGLTVKLAVRSLFRRKSASLRMILCLTTILILVTVAVAGGVIANETTQSWVERAVGRNVVLVAHHEMCDQYQILMSRFYEAKETPWFNYTDERYSVPEEMTNQLIATLGTGIDERLVLETNISEVQGIVFGGQTSESTWVGDNREGTSLVIGASPGKAVGKWFLDGRFLAEDGAAEVVVGDMVARKMFSSPLDQKMMVCGKEFRVVGVCLDPINNGNVTYIPLEILRVITGTSKPNVVMAKLDNSGSRATVLELVRAGIKAVNPEFELLDLDEELDRQMGFLGSVWSAIMLLPLFALCAASLCLISYVVLTVNEQRQEFGVLRATGAKPKAIVGMIAVQNLLVLLSGCAVGIAFGIIITLLILVPEPVVTSLTVIKIAGVLLGASTAMFLLSLIPAVRFAGKPLLDTMKQT